MMEGPFVLRVIHSLVGVYNIYTLQSYETINGNSIS